MVKNYIKNLFTNKESASTEKYLKKYGKYRVKLIGIYRTPIDAPIQKLIDKIVSNDNVKYKDAGYDYLFHLYMIMELVNPKNNFDKIYLLTEKRPNIIWEERKNISSMAKSVQYIKVIVGGNVTLSDMISCSKKDLGKNFNTYEAYRNNCQTYILSLVKCLGVTGVDEFILQPIDDIFKKIGIGRGIAKKVTDIAHFFGRLVGNGYTGAVPSEVNDVISGAETLSTFVPELKPFVELGKVGVAVAQYFGKPSADQLKYASHQELDKKYGSNFKNLVDQYGIDSQIVSEYASVFPERIYTYYYIYNIPNDKSSGLKYPQNYQDLYIYMNAVGDSGIHGANFYSKVKSYATSIGINYDDPNTQKIYNEIDGDKYRLGTTGKY